MNGQILANGLVSLHGADLRMVYVILFKTNMPSLIQARAQHLLSKENQNYFTQYLEIEVDKLENIRDEVLQVDLFLEMNRILKLEGRKYSDPGVLEEQCSLIASEVYQRLQQDETFSEIAKKNPETTPMVQIVHYRFQQLFQSFDKYFQKMPVQDQITFIKSLVDYIDGLSETQQTQIRTELHMNKVTEEGLHRMIGLYGTSFVFPAIRSGIGTSFYQTVVKLLVSFSQAMGITLPFENTNKLSTEISILASPNFFLQNLGEGKTLLANLKQKNVKKNLLPVTLVQIVLPVLFTGQTFTPDNSGFIEEWEKRYQMYVRLRLKLNEERQTLEYLQKEIQNQSEKIKNTVLQISDEKEKVQKIKEQMQSDLVQTELDQLTISMSFNQHKEEYKEIMRRIQYLQAEKKGLSSRRGILKKVSGKFKKASNSIDIRKEEKKAELASFKMVEDILDSDSLYKQQDRQEVNEMKNNKEQLRQWKLNEEEKKKNLEKTYTNQKKHYQNTLRSVENFEMENDGMKDIPLQNDVV